MNTPSGLAQINHIEELLNPDHELPEVVLENDSGEFTEGSLDITHEGKRVGWAWLEINSEPRVAWFSRLQVYEPGHHFGLAAVKNAIQESIGRGYDFRDDPIGMSEEGAHIWLKLADLGLTEVVQGYWQPLPTTFQDLPGQQAHSGIRGHYVVKAADSAVRFQSFNATSPSLPNPAHRS